MEGVSDKLAMAVSFVCVKTHVPENDVGDRSERLALFTDILFEIKKERRVFVKLDERKHLLEHHGTR